MRIALWRTSTRLRSKFNSKKFKKIWPLEFFLRKCDLRGAVISNVEKGNARITMQQHKLKKIWNKVGKKWIQKKKKSTFPLGKVIFSTLQFCCAFLHCFITSSMNIIQSDGIDWCMTWLWCHDMWCSCEQNGWNHWWWWWGGGGGERRVRIRIGGWVIEKTYKREGSEDSTGCHAEYIWLRGVDVVMMMNDKMMVLFSSLFYIQILLVCIHVSIHAYVYVCMCVCYCCLLVYNFVNWISYTNTAIHFATKASKWMTDFVVLFNLSS